MSICICLAGFLRFRPLPPPALVNFGVVSGLGISVAAAGWDPNGLSDFLVVQESRDRTLSGIDAGKEIAERSGRCRQVTTELIVVH